ncbi:MAG: hypothetical protein ACKPKO_55535, partial [Candidatus Fonsibacter sp.]
QTIRSFYNEAMCLSLAMFAVVLAPSGGFRFWVSFLETLVRSSMRLGRCWSGPLCVAINDLSLRSLRLGRRWIVAWQQLPSSQLPDAVQAQAEYASYVV